MYNRNEIRERFIYALVNPENNNHFYIGSAVDPRVRLATHIRESGGYCTKGSKSAYIRDMVFEPKMIILEKIVGTVSEAETCEVKWMKFYKDKGHRLTNRQKRPYDITNQVIELENNSSK